MIDTSSIIQSEDGQTEKKDWAFAIGFACMPSSRPAGCSVETLKTYYHDVFDHLYYQMVSSPSWNYMTWKCMLYGLLMGAVRLCAKDDEWCKKYGFGRKGYDYQHSLCLICPSDDLKVYYTIMMNAVMPMFSVEDESQRIDLKKQNLDEERKTEINSLFCHGIH